MGLRISLVLSLAVLFGVGASADAQSPAPVASSPSAFGSSSGSAFPPVAIQGCAAKVTGNGSIAFPASSQLRFVVSEHIGEDCERGHAHDRRH
jgi:hypothetical protein